VAFEGNVHSRQGVPNLWRFDEPHDALFWLVKLPPVALCNMAMFYASDDNNNYYKDTTMPDKGRAGWAPMCGCLIPIPGEWAALFLDYPDLGTTFRRIVDLINLVDKTKQVKFKYLAQSVAYACFLASKVAKLVSTMASKWKRLIFSSRRTTEHSYCGAASSNQLRRQPTGPPRQLLSCPRSMILPASLGDHCGWE
jgi:hypothetical protein